MTQNNIMEIDFSCTSLQKTISNIIQSTSNKNSTVSNTELYLNKLKSYKNKISEKNSDSDILNNLIVNFNNLKEIYKKLDAFIVIELIETLLQMLTKINSLKLELNSNNIKIIDKSIDLLPNLIKQYLDNNIMFTDDVLWCLDAADAIRENNDIFYFEEYNNNNNRAILFGKEVTEDNLLNINNKLKDLKYNSINIEGTNNIEAMQKLDILCSIACNKNEISFLKEIFDLAKKINDGFNISVKTNNLHRVIFSFINSLNCIKTSAINFNYQDIALMCYFISKVYNSIVIYNINISNEIISILSRLHSYIIKYIEFYLNEQSVDEKDNIKYKIKTLYLNFLSHTNLINNNEVISNNDYYDTINTSNFAVFFETNDYHAENKNKASTYKTQNKYIPRYITAVGLKYNLINTTNQKIDITIDENVSTIQFNSYNNIVSFIHNIVNCSSLKKIINNKISDDNNLTVNIYQEGINLVLDITDTRYTVNDNHIIKNITSDSTTDANISINLYNRMKLLYKIEDKLSLAKDENSLYNLYIKVRKSGGNLLLDKNTNSDIRFLITMPVIDSTNMLVVKSGDTMYAIPSEFVLHTTENLKNKQDQDALLLNNIFNKHHKKSLINNYNEIVTIGFNRKTIPIAVDKIISVKNLSINILPFPITHVKGIDAVGLIATKNIVFIVSAFYLYHIYFLSQDTNF
jgi:hypothetical protein